MKFNHSKNQQRLIPQQSENSPLPSLNLFVQQLQKTFKPGNATVNLQCISKHYALFEKKNTGCVELLLHT